VRQYAPLKRRPTIILHGSISQKTILNIILLVIKQHSLNLTERMFADFGVHTYLFIGRQRCRFVLLSRHRYRGTEENHGIQ
jgi:hypothetical protein